MCCLEDWLLGLTAELKKNAWEKVTAKVTEVGVGEVRTEKAVRKKWTDMSSLIKKKESARRREMSATGGGGECDVKMSDMEMKVLDLLTEEAVSGVVGGMDIGMVEFQEEVIAKAADVKSEIVPKDNVCDDSGTHKEVAETGRKKVASSKRASDADMVDLREIELKRLKVEEQRLEIEQKRLAVEEKRLKLEQDRWESEKKTRLQWVSAEQLLVDQPFIC